VRASNENMAAKQEYTEDQITKFLELAQETGIGRAMRELAYPKSWDTARKWAKNRGVTVNVDSVKQKSKEFHDWYQTEDVLIIAQEGMMRVYEELQSNTTLTSDDHKKLSDALSKHYGVWANAQGKANDIKENRDSSTSVENADLYDMLTAERARRELARKEESFEFTSVN
jgi:hypothetical protein